MIFQIVLLILFYLFRNTQIIYQTKTKLWLKNPYYQCDWIHFHIPVNNGRDAAANWKWKFFNELFMWTEKKEYRETDINFRTWIMNGEEFIAMMLWYF